jgi:uncharacterized protein (TIGR02246 family)
MDRDISRGACALLAAALAGCQSMPSADGTAEAAAIRAQDAAWVAAIAAGDPDKIVAFYSEDAVFMPPNEDALTGPALRKSWADMAALPGVKLSFAPTRVEVDGDGEMAIDVGTYTFSFDSPGGKVQDHGKYAQVWEKHGGQWKCAVDMYNSSVPLPPPAPAVVARPAKKAAPVSRQAHKKKAVKK